MDQEQLIAEYAEQIKPHLTLAKKAYGSRDTVSPQHDASREYTRLLVEYYKKGGSLMDMAKELGVTYAGVRRRVTTNDIPPKDKRIRSKATPEQVTVAVQLIRAAKEIGTEEYHEELRVQYEVNGISLTKIAKAMGLSSANPLYYGVARTKIREREI
jgi:transposase